MRGSESCFADRGAATVPVIAAGFGGIGGGIDGGLNGMYGVGSIAGETRCAVAAAAPAGGGALGRSTVRSSSGR